MNKRMPCLLPEMVKARTLTSVPMHGSLEETNNGRCTYLAGEMCSAFYNVQVSALEDIARKMDDWAFT